MHFDICFPCSNRYHACEDFTKLTASQKWSAILLTALASIITLGFGSVCAFRCLVGRFKRIDETQEPLTQSRMDSTANQISTLPHVGELTGAAAEVKTSTSPAPLPSLLPMPTLFPMPTPPTMQLETLEKYQERLEKINGLSLINAHDEILKFSEAHRLENKAKNRYNNVLPPDEHRVRLSHCPDGKSDYINASLYENIILTQGPKSHTQADFWVMAFENNCQIVCLTDHMGLNHHRVLVEKTFPYWKAGVQTDPPQPRDPKPGDIIFSEMNGPENHKKALIVKLVQPTIKVIVPDETSPQAVTKSVFEVTLGNETRKIIHWYYEKWIDHEACDEGKLVNLILLVKSSAKKSAVHCSAGVGRSGVFAIVKLFIDRYNSTKIIPKEEEIDLEIFNLRKARPLTVQTAEQRELISKAIKFYIEN